jgi:hypothetical protein
MDRIRKVYLKSVERFRSAGDEYAVQKISRDLGFDPPPLENKGPWKSSAFFLSQLPTRIARRVKRLATRLLSGKILSVEQPFFRYQSNSHVDHPTILSLDETLGRVYSEWKSSEANRIQ